MKIYIAGPMTGYERYNFDAFEAAKFRALDAGHAVVTPCDITQEVWHLNFGRPFDPATDRCDYGDPVLCQMLREDLRAVLNADAIALLPGSEKSRGAQLELAVARAIGLRVLDACTMQEMPELSVA
jgi:hypothetical protein